MFEKLKPDFTSGSVYGIDWEGLCRQGIRCALFDLDNTLAMDHVPPGQDTYMLLDKLERLGIRTAIVSNGKTARLKDFAERSGIPCVTEAGKPGTSGIRQALDGLHVNRSETMFFGDQIFTDMLAAKRAGVKACLVAPVSKKEAVQVRIKRPFEKAAVKLFRLLDGAAEL